MGTSKLHLENETRHEVGVDLLPADTLLTVTLKLKDIKVVIRQDLSNDQLAELLSAVTIAVGREVSLDS